MSAITNYTTAGQVAGRYGWYIGIALRELIGMRTGQIEKARKTLELSLQEGTNEYRHRHHPDGYGESIYRSLEAMSDELARTIPEFQQALDALKKEGIV